MVDRWIRFHFIRESPAFQVDQEIPSKQVAVVLERVLEKRGLPNKIFLDNGPEPVSKALDFSRPGKPTDNAPVQSFNGRFRDECLSVNWFLSLEDAGARIEAWRLDYNISRPHTSLGDRTPREFARCHLANLPGGGSFKKAKSSPIGRT